VQFVKGCRGGANGPLDSGGHSSRPAIPKKKQKRLHKTASNLFELKKEIEASE
jgi:hypothetical protein